MSERYIPTLEERSRAFRTLARVDKGHWVQPSKRDMEEALRVCIWALAECYHESGADPDGDEDWRIALSAPNAVRELREDYDEACEELHPMNGPACP